MQKLYDDWKTTTKCLFVFWAFGWKKTLSFFKKIAKFSSVSIFVVFQFHGFIQKSEKTESKSGKNNDFEKLFGLFDAILRLKSVMVVEKSI